jgi:hypothetical protein
MKIFSFGCSGEERAHVVGSFVPYAPGKGPGKFVSAGALNSEIVGNTFVGGGITEGFGQGAGLALGLVAVGSAFAWVKSRGIPGFKHGK